MNRAVIPTLLALIAGFVDVAVYLGAGHVFTSHVTGNLAQYGAHAVERTPGTLALLVVLPAFVGGIVLQRLLAAAMTAPMLRRLLALHAVWLVATAAVALVLAPGPDADSWPAVIVAALAAAAMGAQNASVQMALPHAAATAMMTKNVTLLSMSLAGLVLGRQERREAAGELVHLLPSVAGFVAGCVAAALMFPRLGWGVMMGPAVVAMTAAGLAEAGAEKG